MFERCTKNEARVMAKFGNTVYAQLNDNFDPVVYFLDPKNQIQFSSARAGSTRTVNHKAMPNDLMRMTKVLPPKFMSPATLKARTYIVARDIFAQKKNAGGMERQKLVSRIATHLGHDRDKVNSCISTLHRTLGLFEVIDEG